jgi:hypothetical protein
MLAKISTKACPPSLQHILRLQSRHKKYPFTAMRKQPFSPKLVQKSARMAGGVWPFQHKAHSSNLKQVTFVLYILWIEMTRYLCEFSLFATSF